MYRSQAASINQSTVILIGKFKPGAVGCSLAGVELMLDSPGPNGDGEICFRGRHVFMGYLNQEKKTKETIDENGWLHSGDIGSVDAEGIHTCIGYIDMLSLIYVKFCSMGGCLRRREETREWYGMKFLTDTITKS